MEEQPLPTRKAGRSNRSGETQCHTPTHLTFLHYWVPSTPKHAAVAQSGQSSGLLTRRSQVRILLAALEANHGDPAEGAGSGARRRARGRRTSSFGTSACIDVRNASERCLRGRREPVANRSRTRVRPRFESWSLRQGEFADGEATGFENRHTGSRPGVRLLNPPLKFGAIARAARLTA